MKGDRILNEYFKWMTRFIQPYKDFNTRSYMKLLRYLHDTEFVYKVIMDSNRTEDGEDLRWRFGYGKNYSVNNITIHLDKGPCSILEMMVALVVRCEEHLMDDPDLGDRTGRWFWGMIKNLGLESMNDLNFDAEYVDIVIFRFLNREYKRNGEGGLFTVEKYKQDMRLIEIWYQMCWYLDEILGN